VLEKIPLLSSFAGPTSWALNIGKNLASMFGWSKPVNTLPIVRVNRTFG